MAISDELTALVDAALDQRNPSPELRKALNAYLVSRKHPCREQAA